MSTDASGTKTFNWGTVTRGSDGAATDTRQGAADRGFINQSAGTISVRMSVNTLNAYLAGLGHPQLGFGSVFCGLRGRAQQQNASGENVTLTDLTRGGTEFTIGNGF
jgi:hypothetical protein